MRWLKALGAAVALAALLVGVPVLLIVWQGNPWPDDGFSWNGQLGDSAIGAVLTLLVWIFWAQFAFCFVVETVSVITSRKDPDVPFAFSWQRALLRSLVVAVLAVASSGPISAMASTAPASGPATSHATTAHTAARTTSQAPATGAQQQAQQQEQRSVQHETITVQRGDSLWSLAERHLGDPEQWHEIASLNEGATMHDGDVFRSASLIKPGWQLKVPARAHAAPVKVTVQKGDTLSGLAERHLGDASAWHKLYDANRDVVGGDPDLILPGQVLTLPGALQPAGVPAPQPSRAPAAAQPGSEVPPGSDAGAAHASAADHQSADLSLLKSLLAIAGTQAVGLGALLLRRRRRQFRRRRPGHAVGRTPPELADLERAVVEDGGRAEPDVQFVDRVLRQVNASADRPPQIAAAVLGDHDLSLRFSEPTAVAPPKGWDAAADRRSWTIPRTAPVEHLAANAGSALVSVGRDDAGRTWFLDLAAVGGCGLAGDAAQVDGFRRFLVAELAVNAWSAGVKVLLTGGFAAESVGLNRDRLSQTAEPDAYSLAATDAGSTVVVCPGEASKDLLKLVAPSGQRSRLVVVHDDDKAPAVELAADGSAYLTGWKVTVKAFTLSASEARAMAELVDPDAGEPDPPFPPDDASRAGLTRRDGALRDEHTRPRVSTGDSTSLLPDPDDVYLDAAATTLADIVTLAPGVPEEVRDRVVADDETLDRDVAEWFDEKSPRPKVRLLGAIGLTTAGEALGAFRDQDDVLELVAFLACRDDAVRADELGDQLGWPDGLVRRRAEAARRVLGPRPDDSDWLPSPSSSPAASRLGTPAYELHPDRLVDAELFRRLRARAQALGEDGSAYLIRALTLVGGQPFNGLHPGGYGWLPATGLPDELRAAIVDVAHVVANRALAGGDVDLARWASERGVRADPDADIPRLDLAAAADAEQPGSAAEVVGQIVARDDHDVSPRTREVLDRRGWLAS